MKNQTTSYNKTKQGILPMFISDFLDICDPVLTFDEFMEGLPSEIDICEAYVGLVVLIGIPASAGS